MENLKPLPAGAKKALDFLRGVQLLGGATIDRTTFDAVGGLYSGVFEHENQIVNKNHPDFGNSQACVKTALLGFDKIENTIEPRNSLRLPEGAANHDEAKKMVAAAINAIEDGIATDFPNEYETVQKIRDSFKQSSGNTIFRK